MRYVSTGIARDSGRCKRETVELIWSESKGRCWFRVWRAKYASQRNQYPQNFGIFKLFFSYPD